MVGKSLSHYKITAELGRGGMGIVYKAEDTKLDRTVAIKVLPSATLASDDDRARFYREAKAAAALNHPNIASVYEIDEAVASDAPHDAQPSPFIAMEYIEGETLDEYIKRGPLKMEEAVRLASQIASGLEAAHDKEIVHRDIKAANVMLTSNGDAKILDFGLAQTAQSTKLTRMGSTLGTVAYMSPEQAKGESVDHRTDIWSLGALIYEMLVGRSPFPGDYEQAVVYSILNQDPEPLTAVRTGVPMALEWIVGKCLAKAAGDRYQRMEDLLVDLRTLDLKSATTMSRVASQTSVAAVPATPVASARPTPWYRNSIALIAVVVAFIAGALATFAFIPRKAENQPEQLRRFTADIADIWISWFPSVSADGRFVSFKGFDHSDHLALWIHDLSTGNTRKIVGEKYDISTSAFSPDGRQIVYNSERGIMRANLAQGIPIVVSDSASTSGVSWLDDDTILYSIEGRWWIHQISTGDQSAYFGSAFMDEIVNVPEDIAYFFDIEPIPEHRAALASAAYVDSSRASDIVFIRNGAASILVSKASWAKYSQDGFFTYSGDTDDTSGGSLFSQLFDPATGIKSGAAVPVVSDQDLPFWRYDTGADGTVWISQMARGVNYVTPILSIDPETGNRDEIGQDPSFGSPVVSADGDWILMRVWDVEQNRWDVYNFDVKLGTSRLVERGALAAVWYPDGESILFERSGNLYESRVNGSGTARLVLSDAHSRFDVSGNGLKIAFSRNAAGKIHLFLHDLESGEETPIDAMTVDVRNPQFSPRDDYLVAQREVDNEYRIVVYDVAGENSIIVSDELGEYPTWSSDGKWIYYLSDKRIRRVAVSTESGISVSGNPQTVFEDQALSNAPFSLSPDGRIILALRDVSGFPNEKARIILNWGDELRRRAGEGS